MEINQCVGCTRQFFTKSFLGDGVAALAPSSGEEPHRHAIEQASRTRREILISTQVRALVLRALCHVQDVETTQLAALIRARKRPGQRRPPSESNLAGLVQKRRRQEE